MTSPAPQKLSNIQALRGIAALLVVFIHLRSIEAQYSVDTILPDFMRLGLSGVDLFFVISGFIMVYVTWHEKRTISGSLKFLFARITRIYPLYWLVSAAVLIVWFFKPEVTTFNPSQTSIVKSFLLWPDHTLPMLKLGWTLIHELYFYLMFAVLLLLPRRLLVPGLIVWIMFVVAGNRLGWSGLSPVKTLIFHPLSMEFFMGAMAGWIFKRGRGIGGGLTLIFGLALWILSFYYLVTAFPPTFYPSNWERVLYFGLPGMLIVYGLASVERDGFVVPGWCSTFGDWSYSLYLSHVLVLSALGLLWRPFIQDGPIDNAVVLTLFTVICIAVSAVIWYLFEKPALKLFRALRARLFPNVRS